MHTVVTTTEAVDRLHETNRAVETAMQEVYEEVVRHHKRLGLPLVTWQDGKVVLVAADEIVVEDDNTRQ